MEISDLSNTAIEEVVACLSQSFQGYFVELPTSVQYWQDRFRNARVDFSLSFGVFDQGKLIGFVINGIDIDQEEKIAFNTGTGVIKAYRGNHTTEKMYGFGVPLLQQAGVKKCKLEVIDQNLTAIQVYRRIGFSIQRKLKCFQGEVNEKAIVNIKESELDHLPVGNAKSLYSWDHSLATLRRASQQYKTYTVQSLGGTDVGFFIIDLKKGYLAQLELTRGSWSQLFAGVKQVCKHIRINNVDEKRQDLINYLHYAGIENTIDQFEMIMPIN